MGGENSRKEECKADDRLWKERRRTIWHESGSPCRPARPMGPAVSKVRLKGKSKPVTYFGFGTHEVAAVRDTSTIITHGGC